MAPGGHLGYVHYRVIPEYNCWSEQITWPQKPMFWHQYQHCRWISCRDTRRLVFWWPYWQPSWISQQRTCFTMKPMAALN